jgi:hypothetical protein
MGTGNRYLNAYPFMSKKGVYEGQLSTGSAKRPYILTRSSFVGQQRYAATTWNGDVSPDWDTYRKEIPAGLNYCITGLPYWTINLPIHPSIPNYLCAGTSTEPSCQSSGSMVAGKQNSGIMTAALLHF